MLEILSQNTVFSGFLKSILQCINFSEDVTLLNSVDYIKGEYLTYPNITICHPAFFDMDRLKGKMMSAFELKMVEKLYTDSKLRSGGYHVQKLYVKK